VRTRSCWFAVFFLGIGCSDPTERAHKVREALLVELPLGTPLEKSSNTSKHMLPP